MSVHRRPDGSTVFLCGRSWGKSLATEAEQLKVWVRTEAGKQGRCSRCMGKLGADCVAERPDLCTNEEPSTTAAVAILKGLVAG